MSGGWTSDIVEMQLPYVVRQAIDDTHLGDTIIRWVPSKDIEYGTMAIRFWHDPDNILPITGQPETMVITYPDGVHHLAVIGYVEKIGKESIKVGELMQTDAIIRILHYPKIPSAANGSFPILSCALTANVITEIIKLADYWYLADNDPTANGVHTTVYPNAGTTGSTYNLTQSGGRTVRPIPQANQVFSKRAWLAYDSGGYPFDMLSPVSTPYLTSDATGVTFVVVDSGSDFGSNRASTHYGAFNISSNGYFFGYLCDGHTSNTQNKTAFIPRSGSSVALGTFSRATSVLTIVRHKTNGQYYIWQNGTVYTGSTGMTGTANGRFGIDGAPMTTDEITGWCRTREFAWFRKALSDNDLASLISQKRTEYGI
jgi:hypothetical protein